MPSYKNTKKLSTCVKYLFADIINEDFLNRPLVTST